MKTKHNPRLPGFLHRSHAEKLRFEKTEFGWKAYRKSGHAFIYFGHFYTKREALRAAIAKATQS